MDVVQKKIFFKPLSEEGSTSSPVTRVAAGEKIFLFDVIATRAGEKKEIFYHVELEQDAVWQSVIVIVGEGEVTLHRTTKLLGARASAVQICAGVLTGKARVSLSDHAWVQAEASDVRMKTNFVLKDEATSYTRNLVTLEHAAKGSFATQRIDHLLLSDAARAVGIPEIDVAHDDVTCSHAATFARPRWEELFYLASRGIEKKIAEELLTAGFLRRAFTDCANEVRYRSMKELGYGLEE